MLEKFINELVRLNRKAFIACKVFINRIQYKVYLKKVEKSERVFEEYMRQEEKAYKNNMNENINKGGIRPRITFEDIDPIMYEDCPDIVSLNRHLRNECNRYFPKKIEVVCPKFTIEMRLVDITQGEGHRVDGMVHLNNGYGEIFNYRQSFYDAV